MSTLTSPNNSISCLTFFGVGGDGDSDGDGVVFAIARWEKTEETLEWNRIDRLALVEEPNTKNNGRPTHDSIIQSRLANFLLAQKERVFT